MKPEDFAQLAAVLPEPLLLLSGRGVVEAANARACSTLGRTESELVGQPLSALLVESDTEVERALADARRSPGERPSLFHRVGTGEPLRCRCARLGRGGAGHAAQVLVRIPHVSRISSRFRLLNEKVVELAAEIDRRERSEQALAEQLRLAALGRDVGLALAGASSLGRMLQECVEIIVESLDAAFARIWTLAPGADELRLAASAGIYTHIDGGHARIPVGSYKIGQIAAERQPHLTNAVVGDERVHDQAWAAREGMVAFAGYPLLVDGATVGVVGVFARRRLSASAVDALNAAATAIAPSIERKRIEVDLLRKTEQMERADRRKDEFLAMLGHELRNPLAPLRTGLDLLLLGQADDRTIQTMRGQLAHVVRLVDDLLDVSRITTGKISPRMEPIAVAEVVEAAVETATPAIEARSHHLRWQACDAVVSGDRVRLVQVLTNLLNNAVRYSPSGSHIELTAQVHGDSVVIRCADDGDGMEPELIDEVFDLFAQGDRPIDRSAGGLGIGLALAQRLVRLHSGRLEAFSDGPGKGSEFVVTLPAIDAEPVAFPAPVDPKPSTGAGRRVLVVDDNHEAANTLQALVGALGAYEVDVAYDGPSALSAARSRPPDVILLDLGLPNMDGFEVARALREDATLERVVIIALTGYGSEQDRQRTRAAGFDAHCVKPIGAPDLLQVLQIPARA